MFTLRLLGSASLDGPDGPVAGRAAPAAARRAAGPPGGRASPPLSRDKLVAYLWPESGTDDARHLLRESLYILRSALGDDSVLSTGDDLRLNPDRLICDLWEFEAALARDDLEAAVDVYHGPFLSGFHLTDAEEFERWAEGERSRLARRYGQALEQLAEREMRGGDRLRAVEWWSRLARRGSLQLADRAAVHAGPRGSGRSGRERCATPACTPSCCAATSTLSRSARWSRWRNGSGSSRAPPRAERRRRPSDAGRLRHT